MEAASPATGLRDNDVRLRRMHELTPFAQVEGAGTSALQLGVAVYHGRLAWSEGWLEQA